MKCDAYDNANEKHSCIADSQSSSLSASVNFSTI